MGHHALPISTGQGGSPVSGGVPELDSNVLVSSPPLCASACPSLLFLQYVPEDLLPVYKEKVVPVADIITPNQFEAE